SPRARQEVPRSNMLRLFAAILIAASVATAAGVSAHPQPRLWFEPNRGQAAKDVLFLCRLPGASVELLQTGTRLNSSAGTIVMSWEGAAPSSVEPSRLLSTKINYLAGRDRARWIAGVPSYESVTYRNLYPGIDQVFHPSANALEYDFVVRPNADLSRIRLRVSGARVAIDRAGDLAAGGLTQPKPMLYQQTTSGRREIAGHWVQRSGNEFGFQAANYDHKRALIVDPELIYSTYLQQNVAPQALASDPVGNLYIAGTYWFDPFTYQHSGTYVAKLNADGTVYQYITYLSGSGTVSVAGIALDPAGNAYIAGYEDSADFPVTGTGVLGVPVGNSPGALKAFVAKIDPQGIAVYSDTIGGPTATYATGITVTPQGEAIVSGNAQANGFPVTAGAYQVKESGGQPFLVKIDAAGANVVFAATGIGGSALALDEEGNIYIAGNTISTDYPTTPGAYQTTFVLTVGPCSSSFCMIVPPGSNQYVTKVDPTGSKQIYSTGVNGTNGGETINAGLAVDAQGFAYVTGTTLSSNYPFTGTAIYRGNGAGFLTKLDPTGSSVVYSTPQGGSGIALDGNGNVYVGGRFASFTQNFPPPVGASMAPLPVLGASALPPACTPNAVTIDNEAFVTKADAETGKIESTEYLTGSNLATTAIAVSRPDHVWAAGASSFSDVAFTPRAIFPEFLDSNAPNGAYLTQVDFSANETGPQVACALDAADLMPVGPVAPGQLLSLFGSGLAKASVKFDGKPADVLYASDSQLNVAVPGDVQSPSTLMTISANGADAPPRMFPTAPAAPTLFVSQIGNQSICGVTVGTPFNAYARNADGSVNSCTNPAAGGSIVSFYLNGAGAGPFPPGYTWSYPAPAGYLRLDVTLYGQSLEIVDIHAESSYVWKVDVRLPKVPL